MGDVTEAAADALEAAADAVESAGETSEEANEGGEAAEAIANVVAGEAIAGAIEEASEERTTLDHESRITALETALADKASWQHSHSTADIIGLPEPSAEPAEDIPPAPPVTESETPSESDEEPKDEAPRRSHWLFKTVFGKPRG